MYYVMYDFDGEVYGEYADYEEAERVALMLDEDGEDSWIVSDEDLEDDWDGEPSDLEMGFDPYGGCYTWDC